MQILMQPMKGEKTEKSERPIISLQTKIVPPLQFLLKKEESVTKETGSESQNFSSMSGYTQKQKFEYFLTFRKRLSRLFIVQALEFMDEVISYTMKDFTSAEKVKEVYRTVMRFYKRAFYPEKPEERQHRDSKKTSRNKRLDEKFIKSEINATVYLGKYIDELIKLHLHKRWVISKLDSIIRASLRAAICEAMLIKKPYSAFNAKKVVNFEKEKLRQIAFEEQKETWAKVSDNKRENDLFKKYFSGFTFMGNSLPKSNDLAIFSKEINIQYTEENLISRYKIILSEYTTLLRSCVEIKKEVDFFHAALRKSIIDVKKIRDKQDDFFSLILENKISESKTDIKINKAV